MAVERDDIREVSGNAEERSGRSSGSGGVGMWRNKRRKI
jgi:hypothetical protein